MILVTCPECGGDGRHQELPEPARCHRCDGEGEIPAAAGEGETCHEDMGSDPCGKPVAGERTDPTYGGSYPVCAEHLRPPLP